MNQELQAEIESRDYGTSEDDIKAYGRVAGAAGGAAACAALGAPVASPLCAEAGAFIADTVIGWAYDLFGSKEEEERAKQEARSAAWKKWIQDVRDTAAKWETDMAKSLCSFLREHPNLGQVTIPCSGGWGLKTFDSWFGPLESISIPASQTKIVDAAGFCFPGLRKASDELKGAILTWSPGSPKCPGVFGDYIQSKHEECRQNIIDALETYRQAVISAQIQALASWGEVAATQVYALRINAVPVSLKKSDDDSGETLVVLGVLGAGLLLAKGMIRG